jgi:hypothetical protein
MTPIAYILIALLLAVGAGFIVIVRKLEDLAARTEAASAARQASLAAVKDDLLQAASRIEAGLARTREQQAATHAEVVALAQAQHAAIKTGVQSTDDLARVVADLKAAISAATKL